MTGKALLVFAVAAALLDASAVSASDYTVGPRGSWVTYDPLEMSEVTSVEMVDRGTVYLLFDRQIDTRAAARRQYTRVARRFVDQIGLSSAGEIEIAFEPAFQNVVLHGVRLIRNGLSYDRLDRSRVHVVESDSAREIGIYDGSRVLIVLVPDLRVGDTLEYDYTTVGANPVFDGHLLEELPLEWDVPLAHLRMRVVAPRDTRAKYRTHGSTLEPTTKKSATGREWLWEVHNVAARVPDDRLPSWYHPHAFVELSDFADWGEVSVWAGELFETPQPADELEKRAADIAAAGDDAASRAAVALRFVQEEIRYLAIEIGENSHAPAAPREVLQRRFGDCKDKSLLLVALLRAFDVEANVALVSTGERDRLGERLASPLALDHAVVRVDYGDERGVVWVDPTLVYQRGPNAVLDSRVRGTALVVGREGAAFEAIVPPRNEPVATQISVRMELGRGKKPTWMRVDTLHRGAAAENARREIRSSSVAAAEKAYRDYYAGLYPSLISREPMRVHDNEEANELRVREEYTIARFWALAEDSSRYEGSLFPLELANLIELPQTRARTMPIGIDHPANLVYTIRAEIDLGWAVEPSEVVIEDAAVRFVRRVSAEGNELVLHYEYLTRADHVAVEDAAAYLENLESIRRHLEYPVSRPVEAHMAALVRGPSALNWPKVFGALTIALFAFSLAVVCVCLRYAPVLYSDGAAGGVALPVGGWLNLLIAALAALVVGAAHDLVVNLMPALEPGLWITLTSADSSVFHPFWAPYLMYAIVARLLVMAWLVGVIIACLRRSTRTPALAVGGLFLTLLLAVLEADCFRVVGAGVVDQAGLATIGRAYLNLVAAALVVITTTPYLLWSRRARQTFGERVAT